MAFRDYFLREFRVRYITKVATSAPTKKPEPTARPTHDTAQRLAAVVRPLTEKPSRRIVPAPRKPMPLTTCAGILEISRWSGYLSDIYTAVSITTADPTATRI